MSGAVQCPGFYFLTKYLSNAFKLHQYALIELLSQKTSENGSGAGMWGRDGDLALFDSTDDLSNTRPFQFFSN